MKKFLGGIALAGVLAVGGCYGNGEADLTLCSGLENEVNYLIEKQKKDGIVRDWREIDDVVLTTVKELTGRDVSGISVRVLGDAEARKHLGVWDREEGLIVGRNSFARKEIYLRELPVWASLLVAYHEYGHGLTKHGKNNPSLNFVERLRNGENISLKEVEGLMEKPWTRADYEEKIMQESSCNAFARRASSYMCDKYSSSGKILGAYVIFSGKNQKKQLALSELSDEICNDVYFSLREEDEKASCVDLLGKSYGLIENAGNYTEIRGRLSEETLKRVDLTIGRYLDRQSRLKGKIELQELLASP